MKRPIYSSLPEGISLTQHAYKILFTPEDEGGFSVSVPALPGCFTQGETIEEAM